MTTAFAVELAPFSLAADTSLEDLLAASGRLEREFLAGADGYRGRVLLRRDDGGFADLVFWESPAKARQAMNRAAASPACRSYFACMGGADHADPGQGVTLFGAVARYGSVAL